MGKSAPTATVSGSGLRVLITNNTLEWRAGTELYVRDLAIALAERGHHPIAVSNRVGAVADELLDAGIPVRRAADEVERPDIIHGHHHLDTMAAVVAHPDVPALFTCHGAEPWQETPPRHPAIRRYVAVDHVTRDRISSCAGIDPESVAVLPNFIDLKRFPPRPPVHPESRRLLVLSNTATADNYAALIATEADALGWEVEVRGLGVGAPAVDPGALMRSFDVVVAKGRTALEALAVGCAVIVADRHGLAGWVTPDNLDYLRSRNFGFSTMTNPLTPYSIRAVLAQHDPAANRTIQARIRGEADMVDAVSRWIGLYRDVLSDPWVPDREDLTGATATYLRNLTDLIKRVDDSAAENTVLARELELARNEVRRVENEATSLRLERDELVHQVRLARDALEAEREIPTRRRVRAAVARRLGRQ